MASQAREPPESSSPARSEAGRVLPFHSLRSSRRGCQGDSPRFRGHIHRTPDHPNVELEVDDDLLPHIDREVLLPQIAKPGVNGSCVVAPWRQIRRAKIRPCRPYRGKRSRSVEAGEQPGTDGGAEKWGHYGREKRASDVVTIWPY
jgi:hypothetical protein